MDSPESADRDVRPTPELARLFDEARGDIGEPSRIANVAARLGPALAGGAIPRALWKTRLVAGTLVLGAGVVTLVALRGKPSASALQAAPPAVASVTLTPGEPVISLPPAANVAPPSTDTATPSKPPSVPVVTPIPRPVPAATAEVDPVVEEHALLAQARRSLVSAPADTLALVQQHQRRFPDGILGSEREFLRIAALVRLGRTTEARDARDRFVAEWPSSAYRSEIDRLLESPR